jgi:hypothetical protein
MIKTQVGAPNLDQAVHYKAITGTKFRAAVVHVWEDGHVDLVVTNEHHQEFKVNRVRYSNFRMTFPPHSSMGDPSFGPGFGNGTDGTLYPTGLTLDEALTWTTAESFDPQLLSSLLVPVNDGTQSLGAPSNRLGALFTTGNPFVSGSAVSMPGDGGVVSISPLTALCLIIPAAALNALTVVLPEPVAPGETHDVVITESVTALSFTSSLGTPIGAPTSIIGYSTFKFRFVPGSGSAGTDAWVMISCCCAQDLSPYLTTDLASSTYSTKANVQNLIAQALESYLTVQDATNTYTTQTDFENALTASLEPYITTQAAQSEFATPTEVTSAITAALSLYLKITDAAATYLTISNASETYATQTAMASAVAAAIAPYLTSQNAAATYSTPTQVTSAISAALTSALAAYLTTQAAAAAYLTITNAASTYLPKSHPTVTGAYIADATGTVFRGLQITEGGVLRWNIGTDQANGDLRIYYYNDTGTLLGDVIDISRTTGVMAFINTPTLGIGGSPVMSQATSDARYALATFAGAPHYVNSPFLRNAQLVAGVGTVLFSFVAPRAMTLVAMFGYAETGSAAAIPFYISTTTSAAAAVAELSFLPSANKASSTWLSGSSLAMNQGDRVYVLVGAASNGVGSMDGVSMSLAFTLN